jgi:nucleoside-diphosphate-sugar epimerase
VKVLVTGATGFLGQAVALRLHELGHEVLALGRNQAIGERLAARGPRFLSADLADPIAIAGACVDQQVVIHSGALSSVWGPYADFYRTNVLGTRHVVAGCLAGGVGRLINISSPTLYFDFRNRLNIREDEPLPAHGVNAYATTKRLAEHEIESGARSGLSTVNFRPRGIFGPGDTAILPRLIRANARGMVPIIGKTDPLVDLTYVDNVVDAIVQALEIPVASGRTYNLSNGDPVRLWATLERIFALLGMPMNARHMSYIGAYAAAWGMELAAGFRQGSEPILTRYTVGVLSKSMTLDITAARQDLGYAPRISMDEGMQRFVDGWNTSMEPHTL